MLCNNIQCTMKIALMSSFYYTIFSLYNIQVVSTYLFKLKILGLEVEGSICAQVEWYIRFSTKPCKTLSAQEEWDVLKIDFC